MCVLCVRDMYIQRCRHALEHMHIHILMQMLMYVVVWNIMVCNQNVQALSQVIGRFLGYLGMECCGGFLSQCHTFFVTCGFPSAARFQCACIWFMSLTSQDPTWQDDWNHRTKRYWTRRKDTTVSQVEVSFALLAMDTMIWYKQHSADRAPLHLDPVQHAEFD